MPQYTETQIQNIVQHLPKRLVLAMFIHNRFTNVEIADLDLFYVPTKVVRLFNTTAQDTPEWLETIEMLSEKGGLYKFMLSDASDAKAVWNALIERDFSPTDLGSYKKQLDYYNQTTGVEPFNQLRDIYINSQAYQGATPKERYHEFSILDEIDEYLIFSTNRASYVKKLNGMSLKDEKIFKRNHINNVENWNWNFFMHKLLKDDNLKQQWAHTLRVILKPEVRTSTNLTLLMEAAYYGDDEMVALLLRNGVNVNVRRVSLAQDAEIASDAALAQDETIVKNLAIVPSAPLLQVKNFRLQDTAIALALYYKKANVANLILAQNPDLMLEKNPQCNGEPSILLWAFRMQHKAIVRYMLRHNINVNDCGPGRVTALMYAAFDGDMDFIKRLLELGADVDMQDPKGYKASSYARGGNQVEAMNFLIKKEKPIVEELPVEEELLVEGELHVQEELLVEGELHVQEELLVEGELHVQEELLVEEEPPVDAPPAAPLYFRWVRTMVADPVNTVARQVRQHCTIL